MTDPAGGSTARHVAAQRGHLDVVKQLLADGADPNAREAGDNTYPLHWAAARGDVEVVRALLDGGADVNGFGDVHELDVMGWATVFAEAARESERQMEKARAVADRLAVRGAPSHL